MRLNPRVNREEFEKKAANVKLLLMDVDGVLTDGRLYLLPDGHGRMVETKGFDSRTASPSDG